MKRILAAVLALATPAMAEGQRVFTDGDYFVYREAESCALYADYPKDVMLRVSYRPRAEQTFVSVVAPDWGDRIKVGDPYTAVFYYKEDMNNGYGVPVVGMRPREGDDRVGVAGLAPPGFLERLQSTEGVLVTLHGGVNGGELTRMLTPGIRKAVDELIACSRKHFG